MTSPSLAKNIGLYAMALFYTAAGINHFINPDGYISLIPPYFPAPEVCNVLAGIAEMVFGIGLLFRNLRIWSAWGIVCMLVVFIPVHVYFVQLGSCIPEALCVPAWIGWVRLIVLQPLLVLWAWTYTQST